MQSIAAFLNQPEPAAATVTIAADKLAVVAGIVYSVYATQSTFKIAIGTTKFDNIKPAANSGGVITFPIPLVGDAVGNDVALTLTGGDAAGYVLGYAV